jgi:hypothetical protein
MDGRIFFTINLTPELVNLPSELDGNFLPRPTPSISLQQFC